jgi:hypothetical protein
VHFRIDGARVIDGAQVRAPGPITEGEPEQGDDGALTVLTLRCAVPVLDSYAMGAG